MHHGLSAKVPMACPKSRHALANVTGSTWRDFQRWRSELCACILAELAYMCLWNLLKVVVAASFCLSAAVDDIACKNKVAVTEHCERGEWCALPENFLSANEAFEFALLRINEMRQKCYGFTLAPVRRQDYTVAGTVRKDMEGYSIYKLLLKPTNKFVPLPDKQWAFQGPP